MIQPPSSPIANPYIGPRTFSESDSGLFFGREREARDLVARIVSERLLLFYAQSGAGKSSLLNARVIPRLRDEEGFQVLPVGRVFGELPEGLETVANIYAFNLMASLDQSGAPLARLGGHLTLSRFLARLTGETVVTEDGQRSRRWVYRPNMPTEQSVVARGSAAKPGPRFALVIDQFEEIITSHPDQWEERREFFLQLNQALIDDPNLWIVLTLREDYLAPIEAFAPLLADRMRARFYMERMRVDAALDAIRRPAELGGRPFAEGVAEQLVDNLRQVRVSGQKDTLPGQYVEPVQLQVVCYQLWENIKHRPPGLIAAIDLREAGDVDRALADYYNRVLEAVLTETDTGIDEATLRGWVATHLVTEEGTRGLVRQGQTETAGVPNAIIRELQRRFVVRAEVRSSDTWFELVHDRLVGPILEANRKWLEGQKPREESRAMLAERFLEEERLPSAANQRQAGAKCSTRFWASFRSVANWMGERLRDAAMWPVNLARDLPIRLNRLIHTIAVGVVALVTLIPDGFRVGQEDGTQALAQWCRDRVRRGCFRCAVLALQLLDLCGFPEIITFLWRAFTQASPLTGAEIAAVTSVFGPIPVRYGDIRVAEGGLLPVVSKLRGRAVFTLFETINMPRHGPVQRFNVPVLLNEVVQVLFYERKGSALLLEWMIAMNSVAYDYGGIKGLIASRDQGLRFADFSVMEQAQILQDYYTCIHAGLDTAAYEPFVAEFRAGKSTQP